MVPRPMTHSRRRAWASATKCCRACRKPTSGAGRCPRVRSRPSCFHSESPLSTSVATAEAWMTCTSRAGVYSVSIQPNTAALTIDPASSITYIRPTILGWSRSGTKSVASARPAVWVVCRPMPTSRKATAAAAGPIQLGQACALPPPESTNRAQGMMARPPNWIMVPRQMKGTRRQPSAAR